MFTRIGEFSYYSTSGNLGEITTSGSLMDGTYQKVHIRSLTGMRFVAALLVFASHMVYFWPVFDLGSIPIGGAGVSYFFVLSGFILTYVYGGPASTVAETGNGKKESGDSQFNFRKFYLRRFARIWPLHISTLLICLFVFKGMEFFSTTDDAVAKLSVNVFLLQSWIPNKSWIFPLNGVSWSLAVEAFFYLTFPLLLIGGPKRFVWKFGLILAATFGVVTVLNAQLTGGGSFAQLSSGHSPEASWLAVNEIFRSNPLMRYVEFASGVGCGFWFHSRNCFNGGRTPKTRNRIHDSIAEVAVIAAAIGFFITGSFFGFYPEDYSIGQTGFLYWFRTTGSVPVFVLIIATFSQTRGALSDFLAGPALVYLGEISFAFYMVHRMVMSAVSGIQFAADGIAPLLAGCVFSLAIAVLAASALHHLVELPFRRLIVDAIEKKRRLAVLHTIKESFCAFCLTKRFAWMALFVVISGTGFLQCQTDIFDSNEIARIASVSPAELRDIEFEDDATLLGLESEQRESGDLELRMAWHLCEGRREARALKLLDESGTVIVHGNPNLRVFERVRNEAELIDHVTISSDQLSGVKSIVIYFYEKGRGVSRINQDHGPPANRLTIWTAEENQTLPSNETIRR